jgi:hypothetical protein
MNGDAANRAAVFHPMTDDSTLPCIEVAGVLVFAYIDKRGVFRVSVDLDTADTQGDEVPIVIKLGGVTVCDEQK